jgi:hypothetical protein
VRTPNCELLPEDIEAALALAVPAGTEIAQPVPHSPDDAKAQPERAVISTTGTKVQW